MKTLLNGRYETLDEINITFNSKLFKAQDYLENKIVAIKMIRGDKIKNYIDYNNIIKEITMMINIKHSNIVEFFDFFIYQNNIICIVMEYLGCFTLRSKMNILNCTWSLLEINYIFNAVLDGIIAIHQQKVVHNDIKPENIIYFPDCKIKIIDFGISNFLNEKAISFVKPVGTPSYLAPEVITTKNINAVTNDIYSLGTLLYELLTGVLPFYSNKSHMIINMKLKNDVIPPNLIKKNIPEKLSNIALKALEKNHTKRYNTVKEFKDDFNSFFHLT